MANDDTPGARVNGDDLDDPWVQTIALRLRSLYAAAPLEQAKAGAALTDELARRVAALRTTSTGRRYRVVETLATGGMGTVFVAVDEALDRRVAIKQAAPTSDALEAARRRLRLVAEARIVGRLPHPGIVPIHDLGVDADGEPFFAMQRIDGTSLDRLLVAARAVGGRGNAAERELLRIVQVLIRVAETMTYAHAHGVVHRDLKPTNVMVGAYGEVYVMDWGLARAIDHDEVAAAVPPQVDDGRPVPVRLTISGTVLGTPAYMSPERAVEQPTDAVGEVVCDRAGDIYALGAIVYELLTGSPPYASERADWTVAAILATLRQRPPRRVRDLVPDADPELAAICERAMQREPARRYGDMQGLGADLRAFAEHRIVRAHGGGLATHVRKWVRRNRTLAVTVAIAVLALTVSTAWFVDRLTLARDDARAAATAAEANLRDLLDLAVADQVADLRHRADTELWPLTADRTAAIAKWLRDAEALRPALQHLRQRRAELGSAAKPRGQQADADPWRRRLLDEAIAALEEFFAPLPATDGLSLDSSHAAVSARPSAQRRLAAAATESVDAARAWRAIAMAVGDSPRYGGLRLAPQAGLLPLGIDQSSGLAEFAHLQTGNVAQRGTDGRIALAADDGVVLVLVPGGRFWMGASAVGGRNVDQFAEAINEQPVHEVQLDPFFVAKFELTQGQWQRATGANPSVHNGASTYVAPGTASLHPVESIDWWQARAVLHKLGLVLPTEAQWEHAARGGTSTPWYASVDVAGLASPPAGNLADASSGEALGTQGWLPTPGLRDGFVMHAPVGRFAPSPFGLHDVIGNVAEWCLDSYWSYARVPAPGTGARPLDPAPTTVIYRGGAFDQPAQEARSANRAGAEPTRRHFGIGIRPARALEQR